jgi:hypothetical protein
MKKLHFISCVVGTIAAASVARANIPYLQDYEANANDWNTQGTSTITRVPSGTGGVNTSPVGGGFYAQITNSPDDYQPGYGDAGYTYFGGRVQNYQYDFKQSVDVYVDTTWGAPSNPAVPAFWIDQSPASAITGLSDTNDEHSFQFMVDGSGNVGVNVDGNNANLLTNISSSGWYRFTETFQRTGNGTQPVQNSFSVTDLSTSSPIGSTVTLSNPLMPSNELGGNGYQWFTVWQNGFAGNLLNIDNNSTDFLPEPASLGLLAIGGLMLVRRPKQKREND